MPKKYRSGIFYFLIALIFLNLTYPFSDLGEWQAAVYQTAYAGLFALGIYMVRSRRHYFQLTLGLGVAIALGGIIRIFAPNDPTINIVNFLLVVMFQSIVIKALLEFIFATQRINRDVLYASIAIYLLLGATFAAIYSVIEFISPGSFTYNTQPAEPVTWQRLVYFSNVTLTTLGYGDITPAKPFSQAVAAMEAVMGVLYVAILMARLVSLYVEEDLVEDE